MLCELQVEHHDDGTFEFGPTADVGGGGGEGLSDNGLTEVGGNGEDDAGSETGALLEKLFEEDDDDGVEGGTNDEEQTSTGARDTWLAVETG